MKTVSQRVDSQESVVLYDGKVYLDFDPVKHRYKINGEFAYGVTTALGIINKPFLVQWAASQAADYVKSSLKPGQALDELEIQELVASARKAHITKRDGAADAGTYVHNWIESFVRGEKPETPVNDKLAKVINDFRKWWDTTKPEVISPERMLCSPTHKLAGTTDLICRINGKLTIVDWKTGSGIYPEMFLQMGAYALMYQEETGEEVEQLTIVNASIKNMFQTQSVTQVKPFTEQYLRAYQLYVGQKEVEALLRNK